MRKPTFRELLDATHGPFGGIRITVRNGATCRMCLHCDATFEQTTDGFEAFREHEMTHGMPVLFDWSELDGKTVRLCIVKADDVDDCPIEGWDNSVTDVYAVDEENQIYHIATGNVWHKPQGWKWKYTSLQKRLNGQSDMPSAAALPSNFSETTSAKSAHATAEKTAARDGKWLTSKTEKEHP